MRVDEALKRRKSVRSFLDKKIPKNILEKILDNAKYTPSSTNMQPWNTIVLSNKSKKKLDIELLKAFDEGEKAQMDYQYYPEVWNEPYKSRRIAVGREMYKILGIDREDKESRIKQWRTNFCAFDAPTVMLFFIDKSLAGGSWLDYGMFLQSIMLLCVAEGLGCCPMGSLAEYPNIVRKTLNVSENQILLCGIAVGYEDIYAPINSFRTSRISLNEYTVFHD